MKRNAYEVPGLELEEWINNQISKWEEAVIGKEDRLAKGHIRGLRSVLHHLTKLDCFPEEKFKKET